VRSGAETVKADLLGFAAGSRRQTIDQLRAESVIREAHDMSA
jgi:hypothetical protein